MRFLKKPYNLRFFHDEKNFQKFAKTSEASMGYFALISFSFIAAGSATITTATRRGGCAGVMSRVWRDEWYEWGVGRKESAADSISANGNRVVLVSRYLRGEKNANTCRYSRA